MPNLCDYSNAYILVIGTITMMQNILMQRDDQTKEITEQYLEMFYRLEIGVIEKYIQDIIFQKQKQNIITL